MEHIGNPDWMNDPKLHQQREAREIDQILGWVISGREFLPDGTAKEKVFQMPISKKIGLLRQLEQDSDVSEDHRSDIRALLQEIDTNKFAHE